MQKISCFLVFFLMCYLSYAYDDSNISAVVNHIRMAEYDRAEAFIAKMPETNLRYELKEYLNIVYKGVFDEVSSETYENERTATRNLSLLNNGLRLYLVDGNEIEALNTLKQSLELAIFREDEILVCETAKAILEIYERFNQEINDYSYLFFLETHRDYAYDSLELQNNAYFEYRIKQRYSFKEPASIRKYYLKANRLLINAPSFLKAKLYITNSAYHQLAKKDLDSSLYYLKTAKEVLNNHNGYFENERKVATDINLSVLKFLTGNREEAIERINNLSLTKEDYLHQLLLKYVSFWKYKYNETENELLGLRHYKTYLESELKHNQAKNLQVISNFETKYQTAEKEKQILVQQQRATTNRNWLIVACMVLLLGSGIAILLQKNTTKKHQLAEKEMLLKQQRVDNLLKQQELISIDAMIEGQEKERQKVANELHDDLGSLMATIKLHFNNVKVDQKDPALSNAQKLLDEAYQKIRGMAHGKNSGVMSDQGLLPALRKMAHVISETNALTVTVEDFGMGDRLENTLELNMFRMVQELVANVIKHARATKVHIQLTQHEDVLNIIVEDNGKGFDRTKLDKNQMGMGLTNIEKRLEHLEGSFTVDSVVGKGTSILIDIPV